MSLDLTPSLLWRLAGNDGELQQHLRKFDGVIRVSVPPSSADLFVLNGTITRAGPPEGSPTVSLEVPREFLSFVSQQTPPPGYHGLSMAQRHGVCVKGDTSVRVTYAAAIDRLYELLRQGAGAASPVELPGNGDLFSETDTAIGRYIHVSVDGVSYRVFYEESGTGQQALLLQHTAGADARQWRHQLADPEFQTRFRMIAYDLPYHGRSLPPTGRKWWTESHVPTKDWLMKVVLAIADKLSLEKPIFMGCSVGGQLALDLAAHHSERFGGFAALNGTVDMIPHEEFLEACRDPRTPIDWYALAMQNSTSPLAPEALRREVAWVYASNHRSVFPADLVYFTKEHDLKIDGYLLGAVSTPVYALAGEYDPVALDPEHGSPAVARRFPRIIFKELKGMSHFAPSDDPINFREQVLPVLDEIAAKMVGHK